jgi:signal transduction histidine kinase
LSELGPPAAEALSRLAHGLRTPLALIAGYAELLTIRRDEETLAEAPRKIKEAADELTRIVDDLLTVHAIDANVLYLAPTPTPIGSLVDDAVAAARDRGTTVSFEGNEDSRKVEVLADPDYTRSMLESLLENARNRTANAGAGVHLRPVGAFLRVEVSDRGGDLSEQERARAFDAFSPLEPRTGLTTGLELYKVRRLAQLQRGHVWVDDIEGGETRFGFALPLARAM